jgi:hypothetical protein
MTNGTERNVTWFVAGALLGGAAMAFATPWPGRRVRRFALRKVEDGAEQLSQAAKDFQKAGDDLRFRATKLFA